LGALDKAGRRELFDAFSRSFSPEKRRALRDAVARVKEDIKAERRGR
jgi:hypothetical protein